MAPLRSIGNVKDSCKRWSEIQTAEVPFWRHYLFLDLIVLSSKDCKCWQLRSDWQSHVWKTAGTIAQVNPSLPTTMRIFKWWLQLSGTEQPEKGGEKIKRESLGEKGTFWLALKRFLLAALSLKPCWWHKHIETRRYKLSDQQPWRWQHWSQYQGSAQHYLWKLLLLQSLLHQCMGQFCWVTKTWFFLLAAKWKI